MNEKLRLERAITELEGLQEELANVVEQIARVCDEVGDTHARRTLVANLEIAVEAGGWLSRDLTLPGWINDLREQLAELEGQEE